MARINFWINDVNFLTPNTIEFIGKVSNEIRPGNRASVEFCGTEIRNTGSSIIYDEALEVLKGLLKEDFGYAPYNKRQVKAKLKNIQHYTIEYKISVGS